MTIGERIKKARKALDLTQQAFADRLGMKQNTIATYEMNRTNLSDPAVKSICREFNVNETWLRTGEGEMFIRQSKEDELSDAVNRLLSGESSEFKRRLILVLSKLDIKEWEILEKRLNEIVGTHTAAPAFAPAPARTVEEEARAEAKEYYYQILAEKEQAARSQVLPDDTGSSAPKMA